MFGKTYYRLIIVLSGYWYIPTEAEVITFPGFNKRTIYIDYEYNIIYHKIRTRYSRNIGILSERLN